MPAQKTSRSASRDTDGRMVMGVRLLDYVIGERKVANWNHDHDTVVRQVFCENNQKTGMVSSREYVAFQILNLFTIMLSGNIKLS